MIEVWCACVTALSLGTKVEIIMVWFYCTTDFSLRVELEDIRLDIDVFWHFSFYLHPPYTLYKHIVAVKATIDKQSPHGKLLFKSGVLFSKKALLVELLFINKAVQEMSKDLSKLDSSQEHLKLLRLQILLKLYALSENKFIRFNLCRQSCFLSGSFCFEHVCQEIVKCRATKINYRFSI